mgnify:CR=1 FL=1
MTREEAVKFAEHAVNMTDIPEVKEFYRMAAVALTLPTQEQVEKVWRGEWNYSHTTEIDHFAVVKCSKCGHEAFAIALYVKDGNFCPHCGASMTDEAVEMVMNRLETMKDVDTGH